MPTVLPIPSRPTTDIDPLPAGVVRTPFYLESRGQPLFAWLHWSSPAAIADHGVIICQPMGYEQIHAHRSLRHLADALALAQLPALRLDYHGTGDSAGSDEDPDRHAAWLSNVRDAMTWMRKQVGCTRLSLIGLRLGAALAVEAAALEPVDGLVLWAPVVKGRSYVRELKALGLTATGNPGDTPPSDVIEAAGYIMTAQTAQDMSGLDLLKSRPRCRRALILTRDDMPPDPRLREHLAQQGVDVGEVAVLGYADMMAEPHFTKVPREAINQAVAWLSVRPTEGGGDEREQHRPCLGSLSLRHCARFSAGGQPEIREQILPLSRQPGLFGILSEPAEKPATDLPCVLLINAGSAYRVGPNRLHISLTRQLAARGFRCLRMDLSGLGDSISPDPERENDPYPPTAFRDIQIGMEQLRTRFGAERVVLMGLCSGAYAAFQSAVQLTDPALVESVLINPLTFFWKEGMSLSASPAEKLQLYRACMGAVWSPRKWLKVLSGRSKLGIGGVVRMLVERWRLRKVSGDVEGSGRGGRYPSHPLRDDLPADLDCVARSGRHLTCFFARSDPGHGLLMFAAKQKVNEMSAAGQMSIAFIEDADHTFSRRGPRRAFLEALTEHLGRRYLPHG